MPKQTPARTPLAFAYRDTLAAMHHAALKPQVARSPEVRAVLRMLPPALRTSDTTYVSINSYGAKHEVYIYAHLRNLDNFKDDPRLARVLERFTDAPEVWEANTTDWTGNTLPNRDYRFTRTTPWVTDMRSPHARWLAEHGDLPTSLYISVTLAAYVRSDSPTCRIVTTGIKEEIVRREIKEIVCE